MMLQLDTITPTDNHLHTDLVARLDHRRRVRELRELAAAEGIALPYPATWIVSLELAGYVVDLLTGEWIPEDALLYWPTVQALQLNEVTP
jgi:hypothetical protein